MTWVKNKYKADLYSYTETYYIHSQYITKNGRNKACEVIIRKDASWKYTKTTKSEAK